MTALDEDDPIIVVRRQWNDYRTARYRLSKMSGFHMATESSGIRASSPRPVFDGTSLV